MSTTPPVVYNCTRCKGIVPDIDRDLDLDLDRDVDLDRGLDCDLNRGLGLDPIVSVYLHLSR